MPKAARRRAKRAKPLASCTWKRRAAGESSTAQGIAAGPELGRHPHRDDRAPEIVGIAAIFVSRLEVAAAEKGDAEGVEIARADETHVHREHAAGLRIEEVLVGARER